MNLNRFPCISISELLARGIMLGEEVEELAKTLQPSTSKPWVPKTTRNA